MPSIFQVVGVATVAATAAVLMMTNSVQHSGLTTLF